MIPSRIFSLTYFLSLVVAILAGVFVFPFVFPWPGLVGVWALIMFGFGFYHKTHTPTVLLHLQQSHLTVTIMFAVQSIAGGAATLIYLVDGQFYTIFLTFEVVCSALLVVDWSVDEREVRRAESGVPRLDHQ